MVTNIDGIIGRRSLLMVMVRVRVRVSLSGDVIFTVGDTGFSSALFTNGTETQSPDHGFAWICPTLVAVLYMING